jgi:hypothetical protein
VSEERATEFTESCGCVYQDLNVPCQNASCQICTPPTAARDADSILVLRTRLKEYRHNPHHIDPVSQRFQRLFDEIDATLAALAPQQAAPVPGVKALEWVKHPATEAWRADTDIGLYQVWAVRGISWEFSARVSDGGTAESVDAAKAAAQVHYNSRILSALATPEAGTSEPVAWRGRINTVIKEEGSNGAACGWQACTGCHETNEGYETGDYSFSKTFGCYVGSGCSECGGLGVVWEHISASGLAEMERDHPAPVDGEAVRAAVATVLRTEDWPIFRTIEDQGLDEEQYFEFSVAVLAALATAPTARKEP